MSQSFYSNYELKRHVMAHSGEEHNCDVCEKVFKSKGGLDNHRKEHMGQLKFLCQTCWRKFMYKTDFEGHVVKHEGKNSISALNVYVNSEAGVTYPGITRSVPRRLQCANARFVA